MWTRSPGLVVFNAIVLILMSGKETCWPTVGNTFCRGTAVGGWCLLDGQQLPLKPGALYPGALKLCSGVFERRGYRSSQHGEWVLRGMRFCRASRSFCCGLTCEFDGRVLGDKYEQQKNGFALCMLKCCPLQFKELEWEYIHDVNLLYLIGRVNKITSQSYKLKIIFITLLP